MKFTGKIEAPLETQQAIQKWEYEVIAHTSGPGGDITALREAGEKGWEAVTWRENGHILMKRPK